MEAHHTTQQQQQPPLHHTHSYLLRHRPHQLQHLSEEDKQARIRAVEEKLQRVENTLRALLLSTQEGRATEREELKLWLIKAIAGLKVDEKTKSRKFLQALEGNPNSLFVKQMILFACQRKPQEVAELFQKRRLLFLRDFFLARPALIPRWFGFQFSGRNEHGALALEKFLFTYRDSVWGQVHWRGKRSVPPPVAIQKKNLLMEIDVVKTLYALVDLPALKPQAPRDYGEDSDEESNRIAPPPPQPQKTFWESDFFKESLESGEFLKLDYDAFAEELMHMFCSEDKEEREEVLDVLEEYIESEDFKDLCYKLLPALGDTELLLFAFNLSPRSSRSTLTVEQQITRIIICDCKWKQLDTLLLLNGILNYGKQVVKFLMDEKFTRPREDLREWLSQNFPRKNEEQIKSDELSHWIYRDFVQKSLEQKWRFALLEGFLLLYRLLNFFGTRELLEEVMKAEGIEYEPVSVSLYKEKRRKHAHQEKYPHARDKEETQFIGWRFFENGKEISSNVYNLQDTPIYLFNQYLAEWINQSK